MSDNKEEEKWVDTLPKRCLRLDNPYPVTETALPDQQASNPIDDPSPTGIKTSIDALEAPQDSAATDYGSWVLEAYD